MGFNVIFVEAIVAQTLLMMIWVDCFTLILIHTWNNSVRCQIVLTSNEAPTGRTKATHAQNSNLTPANPRTEPTHLGKIPPHVNSFDNNINNTTTAPRVTVLSSAGPANRNSDGPGIAHIQQQSIFRSSSPANVPKPRPHRDRSESINRQRAELVLSPSLVGFLMNHLDWLGQQHDEPLLADRSRRHAHRQALVGELNRILTRTVGRRLLWSEHSRAGF